MINIKKWVYKWLQLDYYTSQIDEYLQKLDKKYPQLSASQQAEKKKYARVFRLRDGKVRLTHSTPFWDKF